MPRTRQCTEPFQRILNKNQKGHWPELMHEIDKLEEHAREKLDQVQKVLRLHAHVPVNLEPGLHANQTVIWVVSTKCCGRSSSDWARLSSVY